MDANYQDHFAREDETSVTESWVKTLRASVTLTASLRNTWTDEHSFLASVGLTYYAGSRTTLSAALEVGEDEDAQTLQVAQNPPLGEGGAFRATLTRQRRSPETYTFVPNAQYNSRYGIHRAEYTGTRSDGTSNDSYWLSTAGSLAYVAGSVGLTRPVGDSFGLVRLADLEDVRVSVNTQPVGRTNAAGEVFVPELSSYYVSKVTVDDRDIPLEYLVSDVEVNISPPLRSGSLIDFGLRRYRAVAGLLVFSRDGAFEPVKMRQFTFKAAGEERESFTGLDGEFFIEDVQAGTHPGSTLYQGVQCLFTLNVPESEETVTELGTVVCHPEGAAAAEPGPPPVQAGAVVNTVRVPGTAEEQAATAVPHGPQGAATGVGILRMPSGEMASPAGIATPPAEALAVMPAGAGGSGRAQPLAETAAPAEPEEEPSFAADVGGKADSLAAAASVPAPVPRTTSSLVPFSGDVPPAHDGDVAGIPAVTPSAPSARTPVGESLSPPQEPVSPESVPSSVPRERGDMPEAGSGITDTGTRWETCSTCGVEGGPAGEKTPLGESLDEGTRPSSSRRQVEGDAALPSGPLAPAIAGTGMPRRGVSSSVPGRPLPGDVSSWEESEGHEESAPAEQPSPKMREGLVTAGTVRDEAGVTDGSSSSVTVRADTGRFLEEETLLPEEGEDAPEEGREATDVASGLPPLSGADRTRRIDPVAGISPTDDTRLETVQAGPLAGEAPVGPETGALPVEPESSMGPQPMAPPAVAPGPASRLLAPDVAPPAAGGPGQGSDGMNLPKYVVHFDFDRWDVSAADGPVLERAYVFFRQNPGVTARVVGHTDVRGDDAYNLALGMRRARAVVLHLRNLGLPAGRFLPPESRGEETPVCREDSNTCHKRNRRAVVRMLPGPDGRSAGGI
jgi:outer membrane protein OmpA-like peptidoglycan-associated protein